MSEEIKHNRRNFLGTTAMAVAAAQLSMIGSAQAKSTTAIRLPVEGEMPSLGGATDGATGGGDDYGFWHVVSSPKLE